MFPLKELVWYNEITRNIFFLLKLHKQIYILIVAIAKQMSVVPSLLGDGHP